MLKPNNILSYFIKDIKDPKECALYQQINTTNNIEIFYKDKIIYNIRHYIKFHSYIIRNYKNNFTLELFSGMIINYKICSNKKCNIKRLYYKKDNKILKENYNFIYYEFIYNKYLIKKYFDYVAECKSLLCIKIQYYNGFIYLYKDINNYKYKHVQILIMNKYELHYINIFFSLFFVNRNY